LVPTIILLAAAAISYFTIYHFHLQFSFFLIAASIYLVVLVLTTTILPNKKLKLNL